MDNTNSTTSSNWVLIDYNLNDDRIILRFGDKVMSLHVNDIDKDNPLIKDQTSYELGMIVGNYNRRKMQLHIDECVKCA